MVEISKKGFSFPFRVPSDPPKGAPGVGRGQRPINHIRSCDTSALVRVIDGSG